MPKQEAVSKPPTPDNFCPGCGCQLSYSPRTPWRFCGDCIEKATDVHGNAIRFIGLGSEWCYAEGYGPDAHDRSAIAVMCLIIERPVIVHEARQGGVVAEPLYPEHHRALRPEGATVGHGPGSKGVVDLTNRHTLDAIVAERLVHAGRTLKY